MCTVIFHPSTDGYLLGMNRDESRQRPRARAPFIETVQGVLAAGPSEPKGGTWIRLNQRGNVLALINWYSISAAPIQSRTTRGEIIDWLIAEPAAEATGKALAAMNLSTFPPFRLVGLFAAEQSIREWRWDQERLEMLDFPWKPSLWASSGYNEPAAQKNRLLQFHSALKEEGAGSRKWLRQLHRSHHPVAGAESICMHRPDAVTVSFTEVQVDRTVGRMRYVDGSPCEAAADPGTGLELRMRK